MKKLFALLTAAMMLTCIFAVFASAEKTTYKTTDKIEVSFENFDFGWIAIYAGEPFDVYGSDTESGISCQYAYVKGSGKVVFNDIASENALIAANDTSYDDTSKVYYNEPETVKALSEGDYHIVLFKGTGYEVIKQLGTFKVSDSSTEDPEPSEEPTPSKDPAPSDDPAGNPGSGVKDYTLASAVVIVLAAAIVLASVRVKRSR